MCNVNVKCLTCMRKMDFQVYLRHVRLYTSCRHLYLFERRTSLYKLCSGVQVGDSHTPVRITCPHSTAVKLTQGRLSDLVILKLSLSHIWSLKLGHAEVWSLSDQVTHIQFWSISDQMTFRSGHS